MKKNLTFKNIIYQKDRRIRIPKEVADLFSMIGGKTSFNLEIDDNKIILMKNENNTINNYGRKTK